MRGRAIILLLVSSFVTAHAAADVIHLKNGRTIWADEVRDKGTRVEYDVGDDSYAIPKSSIDHIESGGMPPQFGGGGNGGGTHAVPDFTPPDTAKVDANLLGKIIHDGSVDPDALTSIEQQGNAKATAMGYFIAGKYELEHGNFPKARKYFETAMHADPENPSILNYYASMLVRTGNPGEALPYAERAVRIAPDSADTLAVLGYAQYASDRVSDAIRTWKRSLQIRPDASIQHFLEKAEKDASTESSFSENESSHFTLRYEGHETSPAFRQQIIATLDSAYDDLVNQFGVAPRNTIAVILYTDQQFFDVTNAPSWTGALNDGKLRIPINGLTSVTPELARVLKHELAHSFINQLSAGRCPQWLHEGIAQAMEPKRLRYGPQLAQLYGSQREIPFNALEGSFMQFSGPQAVLAYEESLAAADYIIDTYGVSDLQRILARLGEGSSAEAALRATIHSDYGQLEDEVGKYLADKYGK
jgi:tetratricopeptide (TPR) repeat protein